MNVRTYNRDAWDKAVDREDPWTTPVSSEVIAKARCGDWSVRLTPSSDCPRDWFPEIRGRKILALAAGGGHQGPMLAAAGADVTVFDNSPKQLRRDLMVAEREGLALRVVEGDMRDLSAFGDGYFDIVINPVSVCFTDDVRDVWRECARVCRARGILMAGFLNPALYLFDKELENRGVLQVKYGLPYSDLTSLTDAERARFTSYQAPMEFSHTLSDLIGGQMDAGFQLTHMTESKWGGGDLMDRYMAAFISTRAIRV